MSNTSETEAKMAQYFEAENISISDYMESLEWEECDFQEVSALAIALHVTRLRSRRDYTLLVGRLKYLHQRTPPSLSLYAKINQTAKLAELFSAFNCPYRPSKDWHWQIFEDALTIIAEIWRSET